jgi:hypothetical protein
VVILFAVILFAVILFVGTPSADILFADILCEAAARIAPAFFSDRSLNGFPKPDTAS